jgi:hypothetical protein
MAAKKKAKPEAEASEKKGKVYGDPSVEFQ